MASSVNGPSQCLYASTSSPGNRICLHIAQPNSIWIRAVKRSILLQIIQQPEFNRTFEMVKSSLRDSVMLRPTKQQRLFCYVTR